MMKSHGTHEIKHTHFRWIILSLIFFITIVNYIDRSSISFAIHYIANQFHLNDDDIGMILGAFGIGYIITTFLGGIWVDRYGAKITLFFFGSYVVRFHVVNRIFGLVQTWVTLKNPIFIPIDRRQSS